MKERVTQDWTFVSIYTELQLLYIATFSPMLADIHITNLALGNNKDRHNTLQQIDQNYEALTETQKFPSKQTLKNQAAYIANSTQMEINILLTDMWKKAKVIWPTE